MSNTKNMSQDNNIATTLAFLLLGTSSVGVFLCMPVIGAAFVEHFEFTAKQVGEFSFIQLASLSAGCLLGLFLSRHIEMRKLVGITAITLIAMEVISPFSENYYLFLSIRSIAGIAGGVMMALATGALAASSSAEKNFGFFLLAQMVFSLTGIWLIPQLTSVLGVAGVFVPLIVIELVVVIFFLRYIPAEIFGQEDVERGGQDLYAWFRSGLMLVAILIFFIAIGCFWTYVGLIGINSGYSEEQVGRSLSIATIGGALGACVPVLLGKRTGHFLPIFVAACLLVLAIYITSQQASLHVYTLAAVIFYFGWYAYHPYQMSILASIDMDGRPVMASAALTGLGLGLGPALVSQSLSNNDMSMVYSVSSISFVLGAFIAIGILFFSTTKIKQEVEINNNV